MGVPRARMGRDEDSGAPLAGVEYREPLFSTSFRRSGRPRVERRVSNPKEISVKTLVKTVAFAVFALISRAALAAPLPLPPGYPTLLGFSCGGVHVSSFVTGFDSNGNITGEVYAWTKCGGSGKGGGSKPARYQWW